MIASNIFFKLAASSISLCNAVVIFCIIRETVWTYQFDPAYPRVHVHSGPPLSLGMAF